MHSTDRALYVPSTLYILLYSIVQRTNVVREVVLLLQTYICDITMDLNVIHHIIQVCEQVLLISTVVSNCSCIHVDFDRDVCWK